jgi:glycosyltransferase involved in cell wall biosynthesis
MKAGIPPISTAVGGVPEMYDSSCGFLVKADGDTVNNISNAVNTALELTSDTYKSMKHATTARFNQQFTHMEEDYRKLFESVVE